MKERTKLALILAVFAACWFLPSRRLSRGSGMTYGALF